LNTAQPAAAKHPPARESREPTEESAGEESLTHHAERVVVSRLRVMMRTILDPCISTLQGLRKRTVGPEDADEEAGDSRRGSRNARPGGGRDAAERADEGDEADEAPRPKRRLLTYLIYFSMLLAGGMIGGALAYELLASLVNRQAMESRRLEAAMAKQSKSAASNEKKLAEALSKRVEAEKKLEEAKKKQTEAEKKLETTLADTKAAAEKQKKLDDAVKLLEQIRGSDRSGTAPRLPPTSSGGAERNSRPPPVSSGSAERNPRPLKSGDCTLGTGDVKGLKDCVNEFNR